MKLIGSNGADAPPGWIPVSRGGNGAGRPPGAGSPSGGARSRVVVLLLDRRIVERREILEGHVDGAVRAKDELDRVHVLGSQFGKAEPGDSHRVGTGFDVNSSSPRRIQVHDERRDGRLRVVSSPSVLPHALPKIDHRAVEDMNRAVTVGEEWEIEVHPCDEGAPLGDVHLLPQVRIKGVRRDTDVVATAFRAVERAKTILNSLRSSRRKRGKG